MPGSSTTSRSRSSPPSTSFAEAKQYLGHLDGLGVERGLVLPNYGIPVQAHAFSLNDLVLDSVTNNERLVGGLWVSILPQNKELTLKTLESAGERGIKALKTTFLLGGNPDPNTWDDETRELAEACLDAAERHDLVFHFHTSAGGASDINNFVPLVERYGKGVKIYLVHFGGGVSGHIKLVPQFLDWVEEATRSTATRRGPSVSGPAG
jgi:predicted TIM-barrel fold metal-dependent hydrolase